MTRSTDGEASTRRGTVGALGAGASGRGSRTAPTGYRAGRTLPVRVELVRQLRRRRTQVTFGLVALLPVVLWIAFSLAPAGPRRRLEDAYLQLVGEDRS